MGKQKVLKTCLVGALVCSLGIGLATTAHAQSVDTEYDLIELNRDKNQNLIIDSSFENGRQHWKTTGQGTFTDYPECAATGLWCGLLPANTNNACVYQVIQVKPNTEYVAKAKILLASSEASAFFNVKTPDVSTLINNAEVVVTCTPEQAWQYQDIELIFNTGNYSEIAICAMKWTDNTSDAIYRGQVYVDDVSLVEKNPSAAQQYDIVWADDFNGHELDTTQWGYELGCVRGVEQEHYVNDKENVYLENGKLVLKATDRPVEDQYINPRGNRKVIYNSGSVRTHGKKEFLYGRIEMKAKLPKGKGAFPAFWTLGADFNLDGDISSRQGYGWPACGEIDIMEMIGGTIRTDETNEENQSNKVVYATPHFYYANGDADKDGSYSPYELGRSIGMDDDFNDEYHIFGINWSEDRIEWYLDGEIYSTIEYDQSDARIRALQACFNKPQYIQMNLATGGNWAKNAGNHLAEDNTEFAIDWVRYYQNDEQKASSDDYYSDSPVMKGIKNISMMEGETPDLTEGITVTNAGDKDYVVDYSIEDEYMYNNSGDYKTSGAFLRCEGVDDIENLKSLKPGVYNIYYTAYPKNAVFSGKVTPTHKINRQVATLMVFNKDDLSAMNLYGKKGMTAFKNSRLSDVELPKGYQWADESLTVNEGKTYSAKYAKESGRSSIEISITFEEILTDSQVAPRLKEAKELLSQTNVYTAHSIANLNKAITEAQAILDSKYPTQSEVNKATQLINSAIMNLKKVN